MKRGRVEMNEWKNGRRLVSTPSSMMGERGGEEKENVIDNENPEQAENVSERMSDRQRQKGTE